MWLNGMNELMKGINMEEMIKRIDEDFGSSPVNGVCVLDIRDWMRIKQFIIDQNKKAKEPPVCKCVVKLTEIKGLCLMYPRYECPVHGHLHQLHV